MLDSRLIRANPELVREGLAKKGEAIDAPRPLLGAHMSTTGGLRNGISSGFAIGCNVVQVFTKCPNNRRLNRWRRRGSSCSRRRLWELAGIRG